MRPSQWSDLLVTDSGSSLPLPTTKNSGDGRMRRSIARVTSFGTQDDANMPKQIWHVRLQRAQRRANDLPQCAEGPGPSTVAALSPEAPNYRQLL